MKLQISKYCMVDGGQILIDGETVFLDKSRENFKEFIIEAYKQKYITYPKFFKMDNLAKLGFVASELLLHDVMDRNIPKTEMGIILANRSSSLDTDEKYQKTIIPGEDYFPSPSVFVYTLPNIAIGEICIRNKILGENTFFIYEHFDSDMLCNYVIQLFIKKAVSSCLTGWLEFKNDEYFAFLMLIEAHTESDKIIFDADTVNELYKRF
jgi:hypothetical protein